MKYCFGDDAEFVAVKHYDRLQRELTEAQDKIEELVEIGLTQMDKERSLKRELAEAREDAANQRRLADLALAHRDVIIAERDTLAEALGYLMQSCESIDCEAMMPAAMPFAYIQAKQALAAVKGGSDE